MQCKGKNHYWGKILKQFLIGFQVRQKNFSLPGKAKGRYLQVTFQLQNTQGCWKMKVRLVFAHFRIEVSVSFYMYVYLSRLCSNRARWPVAPNFCSRATRKSLPFHRNHMLGTLDFTSSEHWAPFNFPQSTALFMYNCFSGEDCCSVSDTGGSYKNSSTTRIGVKPIRFWLLVQMLYYRAIEDWSELRPLNQVHVTNILHTALVGLVSNNALEAASSDNTMWMILRFLIEALLCPPPLLPL